MKMQNVVLEKTKQIRLLCLDVDGVLTDGRLFFDADGTEYKAFHARDGHGIKLLRQSGVEVAVISGRRSASVEKRMAMLDISHVYQGYQDKLIALDDLRNKMQLELHQIAHVGDDVLDLPIMLRVGLAVAVQDAHIAVKQRADWSTSLPGGYGAVREVCDSIMQAQGTLEEMLSPYLSV